MRLPEINEIQNSMGEFNENMLLLIIKVNMCTSVLLDLYIATRRGEYEMNRYC